MDQNGLQVWVLVGVSAIHKQAFAKNILNSEDNWMFVDREHFRYMNFADEKMGVRKENLITEMILSSISGLLVKRSNVVTDIASFKKDHYEELVRRFNHLATITFDIIDAEDFIPKKKDINDLNALKENFDFSFRPQLIEEQKVLEQNSLLPKAIICDLDGTLSFLNGRSSFDASKSDEDILNIPVANVLKNYTTLGYKILLVTGRYERYRRPTLKFLEKHGIHYDALWMRANNDFRKDAVVKTELFVSEIQSNYFVEFVLDDRNQVVDMWRKDIGLPCFQVNYGDF